VSYYVIEGLKESLTRSWQSLEDEGSIRRSSEAISTVTAFSKAFLVRIWEV
jgi:hypothetical protein